MRFAHASPAAVGLPHYGRRPWCGHALWLGQPARPSAEGSCLALEAPELSHGLRSVFSHLGFSRTISSEFSPLFSFLISADGCTSELALEFSSPFPPQAFSSCVFLLCVWAMFSDSLQNRLMGLPLTKGFQKGLKVLTVACSSMQRP